MTINDIDIEALVSSINGYDDDYDDWGYQDSNDDDWGFNDEFEDFNDDYDDFEDDFYEDDLY